MFNDPLFTIMILAMIAVAIILMMGLGSFGLGGEIARKHSNRFMRYRVYGQAVAIALIVLFVWLRSRGAH